MTTYVAGVDGGQSSTVAAIAETAPGRELGRGSGPPADLVGEAAGSNRQADAITAAIRAALAAAMLSPATPLAAIVVGLTGFEEGDAPPALPFPGARTRVVHDTVTAHAGALGGAHGIVTIAGTGSVVYGTDASGRMKRAGGWGFLFGDEGSAFAIGRMAIAHAMAEHDAGVASVVGDVVGEHFERPLRAVQAGYAAGTIGRPSIAGLARALLRRAPDDAGTAALVHRVLQPLTMTVGLVDTFLGPAPEGRRRVSFTGGCFASDWYRDEFRRSLRERRPGLDLAEPLGDGVDGALTLARRLAAEAGAP